MAVMPVLPWVCNRESLGSLWSMLWFLYSPKESTTTLFGQDAKTAATCGDLCLNMNIRSGGNKYEGNSFYVYYCCGIIFLHTVKMRYSPD